MKYGFTKKLLKGIAFIACSLILLFLLGPRASTRVQVRENDLPEIEDLVAHLAESESKVLDLIPETRKRIVWAGKENTVTPIAFVFLHGFSDSNRAQGNSIDRVAAEFGANVFYTRYAGHGHENDAGIKALGDATLQMWADDTIEALRIGNLIGDKVVVIGFSTGAPLATWASTTVDEPSALILISPNFGLRDRMSERALGPWGKTFVRVFAGKVNEYGIPPVSDHHERYATSKYGSNAIVTMMTAVELGRSARLENLTSPVLVVYSENDQIISPTDFREAVSNMSASITEEHSLTSSTGHPDEHILLGNVVSSEAATREAEEVIINFIRKHVSVDLPKTPGARGSKGGRPQK